MATLWDLLARLSLDASGFDKGIGAAAKSAESGSVEIGKSFSKVGKDMVKTGGIMTATMTAPIVLFGKSAADAASSLDESMNKVQVVFGESADAIVTFSEDSAQSMGLSKQAALEYAGTFGNLFSAMGVSNEATTDMSTGLIQLAADLASFNNIDPTEALDKLRAGMVGETEPLRTLGVNLSAAAVEAQALSMGLGDAAGNFTTAELATARYALIMQQTSLAQGDFERTSEGVANQQRIAAAEFENLSATLGASLIPTINRLLTAIIPLIEKFNNMSPATQNTVVAVLGVIAALGPLISIIGTVISVVGGLITAFGAGGVAATALGTVGTFLSGTVLPALGAAIAAIGLPVIALVAAIGLLIFVIVKFGSDAWNTITMVSELIRIYFGNLIKRNIDTLVGAFNGIGNAISGVISWVQRMITALMSIKLPAWLTPGSPTPFELGLKGIANEMSGLVNTELPQFTAGLKFEASGINALTDPGNIQNGNRKSGDFQQEPFDYDRLARVLRDALAQVM